MEVNESYEHHCMFDSFLYLHVYEFLVSKALLFY